MQGVGRRERTREFRVEWASPREREHGRKRLRTDRAASRNRRWGTPLHGVETTAAAGRKRIDRAMATAKLTE